MKKAATTINLIAMNFNLAVLGFMDSTLLLTKEEQMVDIHIVKIGSKQEIGSTRDSKAISGYELFVWKDLLLATPSDGICKSTN